MKTLKRIAAYSTVVLGVSALVVAGLQTKGFAATNPSSNGNTTMPHAAAAVNPTLASSFIPPGMTQRALYGLGLEVASYHLPTTFGSVQAMQATSTVMKQFGGTSQTAQLVLVSRRFGASSYTPVPPELANGDPNIVSGRFHNVPCLWVTIGGVDIPSTGGPNLPGNSAPSVPDAHQLNVLVDATNGKILMIFAVHQDQ